MMNDDDHNSQQQQNPSAIPKLSLRQIGTSSQQQQTTSIVGNDTNNAFLPNSVASFVPNYGKQASCSLLHPPSPQQPQNGNNKQLQMLSFQPTTVVGGNNNSIS